MPRDFDHAFPPVVSTYAEPLSNFKHLKHLQRQPCDLEEKVSKLSCVAKTGRLNLPCPELVSTEMWVGRAQAGSGENKHVEQSATGRRFEQWY